MGFGFLWSVVESEWTGLGSDGNNGQNEKVRRISPVFRGVRHVISICSKTVTSKRNGMKSTKRMKQTRSTSAVVLSTRITGQCQLTIKSVILDFCAI